METRFLVRALNRLKPSLPLHAPRVHSSPATTTSRSKSTSTQVNPIGDYYASLLESSSSTPTISSNPPTTATGSSSPPITTTPSSFAPSDPAILFSSRLSSPLERRSEIQRKSTLIAGVWVPPRPTEPDNCCMSGCVNCVWDRYRDEVEEWALKKKEADEAVGRERGWEEGRKRRQAGLQSKGAGGLRGMEGRENNIQTVVSMDDDGGGSEANWDKGVGMADEDLFKGVPVGIREFMKQEKRLREKRARETQVG